MQRCWDIVAAMLHCKYKAWTLARSEQNHANTQNFIQSIPAISMDSPLRLSIEKANPQNKVILSVLYHLQKSKTDTPIPTIAIEYSIDGANPQKVQVRVSGYTKQVQKLVGDIKEILSQDQPPAFYKNPHCPQCQFKDACHAKLKEKDCISLLSGMSPKIITKFHNKGVYSIAQLSHLFRPRRRRRHPQVSTSYLWELKAKAITEQTTFVLYPPDIQDSAVSLYIDFEGIPEEGWIYLIGVLVTQQGREDEKFSFWADKREQEADIFTSLFSLIRQYPEGLIYHYGSYEPKALKQVSKKGPATFKNEWAGIEHKTINILAFLRTHVYPPIYSNGLKDLARFLGFNWSNENADGLLSLRWRKDWENGKVPIMKEQLIQYNQDDCKALVIAKQWLYQLATNADSENVKQVAEMKRQSMFKFQANPELGADFQFISKAAYFDYQRTKIYWRNKDTLSKDAIAGRKPDTAQQGSIAWQPKQVNEVVTVPPLKECPHCGCTKLYHSHKLRSMLQTDLKFTSTGIRQYVRKIQSGYVKCTKCYKRTNNQNLRIAHYGDDLFAYIVNQYISYNISNEKISKMIQEQFGIWISPLYLINYKSKWCKRWKPEAEYIWHIIRNSPVIHIDETAIHLDKGSGYVWIFATPHTVFYHYTATREGEFLHEWLKDYKGVIVTDFFPSYESLPITRQKCLVHLIRDLNDDLFKNPFDEEYKIIVTGFNILLRKIIETIDRYGLKSVHLQKHLKDTAQFKSKFIDVIHKSELSIKCTKRFQKHWEQLWTFMYHDGVPWNNNNAEAGIKAFAQYRRGVKGMVSERSLPEYLQMLSIAQTCRYRNISFLSFLRYKEGIWQNVPYEVLPGILPFNQARLFVRRLKFQRRAEWLIWAHSDKRPAFIPLMPDRVYKNTGWVNWYDWVGFSFLPFEKARTYMRKLGLKNRDDYREWLKSGKRPKTIPHEPEKIYEHTGWNGLGDWLGTGNISNNKKGKLPYEQTKAYVQTIGIKTWQEYIDWSASGKRPVTIPAAPDKAYYEFQSWGDFLGTNSIANQQKVFWDYQAAKDFLAPLNIRSLNHFQELCKRGAIPNEIPRDPKVYYKKQGEWIGSIDFLGKKKGANPGIDQPL